MTNNTHQKPTIQIIMQIITTVLTIAFITTASVVIYKYQQTKDAQTTERQTIEDKRYAEKTAQEQKHYEEQQNFQKQLLKLKRAKQQSMAEYNDNLTQALNNQANQNSLGDLKSLLTGTPDDDEANPERHFEVTPVDKLSGFLSIDQLDGLQKEKEALQEFMLYIKNPADAKKFGLKPPTGALFYGVPGTGKTTLARALAKESQLPYIEIVGSEFSKKYVGEAPKLVKTLFTKARELAEQHNGAIICVDEAEGAFRDLNTLGEGDNGRSDVVNQFKAEMTSMKNNPDKPIFLIGTTNHADQIEDAMLDRFTYKIEVFLPDLDAVKAALNRLAKKMQLTDEAKNYLQNEMATKIHQHDELRSFRSMGNYMQKAAYIAYSQHKEKVGKEQLDAAFASLAQRTPLNDKYLESLPDVPALDLNNPTPEEIKAALPSDLQDDTTLTIDPTAKTVKITANPTNSKYTGEIEVAYTTTTKPAPTPEPNNTPDKK